MSASLVTPASAFDAGLRFEEVCGHSITEGYWDRLFNAAADALGRDWYVRHLQLADQLVIEHRGGRVSLAIVEGVFQVTEVDLFGFERGVVSFAPHRMQGDRVVMGARALRFASQLAAELAR